MNGALAVIGLGSLRRVPYLGMSDEELTRRSGFFPRWLASVGFATGLLMTVVPFVAQPMGLAFPAWVFLVSVVVLVTDPDHDPRPRERGGAWHAVTTCG